MERKLYTIQEVEKMLTQNKKLLLSADEAVLDKLPQGDWIGGTIPYFMAQNGGRFSTDKIFVDDFTEYGIDFKFEKYTKDNINTIAENSYKNGFVALILPVDTPILSSFSINSLHYKDIFKNPVVGFVAGMCIDDYGKKTAIVYFGKNTEKLYDNGVAIHVKLPPNKIARAEIINVNTIDRKSAKLKFPKTSFHQSDCFVNGKKTNLIDYLQKIKYPKGLPIIADYHGALINRDFNHIDYKKREALFFAPVSSNEVYYLVKPIKNYDIKFEEMLVPEQENLAYSCACISYYIIGSLQNKKIGFVGAFTYGEIAYLLLNQTFVNLFIDKI